MAPSIVVARVAEMPVGTVRAVEAGGRRLALCRTDSGFYAVDNLCSHEEASLADGTLQGTLLECPRHGARFDVTTGRPMTLPAVVPVTRYPVRVDGDQVSVEVP